MLEDKVEQRFDKIKEDCNRGTPLKLNNNIFCYKKISEPYKPCDYRGENRYCEATHNTLRSCELYQK